MTSLRYRAHAIIDNISEQKIAEVIDFLESVKAKEELIDNSVVVLHLGNLEDTWRKALDNIKKELTEVSFNTWLRIIEPISISENVIQLGVPSEFEKGIIECRYSTLLKTALRNITNRDFELEFYATRFEKNEVISNKEITAIADKEQFSINPKYSFDTFVVGEHNKSAYKHVFAAAKNPNNNKLIYIYGEVGVGKTHLLQAAGNYILEQHPGIRIRYMSIDDFIYEMIEALKVDDPKRLINMLLDYDVLLIDNLQFIAGKEATQEEFLKIVSELLERNKKVIIAATEPPQNIIIINERFTSRFEMGGVFEIKRPDVDTRLEILRRKQDEVNSTLTDEQLKLIAESNSDNVRELINAFYRFAAMTEL